MKELLRRASRQLGLLDNFKIELTVSPQTVKDRLSKKTDDYQPDLFDIFTFNKKEYKGFITTEKFVIKKCKSFPVSFDHWAEAVGKMKVEDNRLIINGEVKSIQVYMTIIGFALTALLFASIGLFAIISTLATGDIDGLYAAFAILAFGTIFLGLPILVMRWSVRNLKTDLEDELKKIRE
jgi:hypothetical protein